MHVPHGHVVFSVVAGTSLHHTTHQCMDSAHAAWVEFENERGQ